MSYRRRADNDRAHPAAEDDSWLHDDGGDLPWKSEDGIVHMRKASRAYLQQRSGQGETESGRVSKLVTTNGCVHDG